LTIKDSARTYPTAPPSDVSVLEIPCGVLLTPSRDAGWAHDDLPATDQAIERVALWHTRLGVRRGGPVDEDDAAPAEDEGRTVRATWAGSTVDFNTTLDSDDRRDLVRYGRNNLPPIGVRRLMLSTLGAWFDVKGTWNPSALQVGRGEPPAALEEWEHRMTLGRDHYVRVVTAGFLFPFGHRASLVKVSERKLQSLPNGTPAAFVRQRMFVIVREHEKQFDLRGLPFRQVNVLTRVTPDHANPATTKGSQIENMRDDAFWPMVPTGGGATDFLFRLSAVDHAGQVLEFESPLAFIDRSVAPSETIQNWISGGILEPAIRRERQLGGRRLCFAPPGSGSDCALETFVVELRGRTAQVPADLPDIPPFFPDMVRASTRIEAVRNLTGKDALSPIVYDPAFRNGTSNPVELFARLEGASKVAFENPRQAGGLVTPQLDVTALSRSKGAVGGQLTDLAAGKFDPKTFFDPAALPKILGILDIADLIDAVSGGAALAKMPQLATLDPRTTRFTWKTSLAPPDEKVTDTHKVFGSNGTSELSLTVTRKLASGTDPAESVSEGSISNFHILIPPAKPVLKIPFTAITFRAVEGRKPDASVEMGAVEFLDVLAFINKLSTLLPPKGFQDPPSLEVTPEGIKAGYSLGLPTVGMGIFSMQNLALSAGFHLPLIASGGPGSAASLHFAFSERHNPFIVTVSLFGGGGFAGIDLGLKGLNALEASIEFGAAVAMSIGVASGGVSVMAGIYIKLEAGENAILAGFVRVVGVLEVLGIVSISAQFYLELSYQQPKVAGTASLVVKVKVLFFSKKVELTVHREFQSSPPPTFGEVMSESEWETYCDAFAPEGV
jgi:hypothetical protein